MFVCMYLLHCFQFPCTTLTLHLSLDLGPEPGIDATLPEYKIPVKNAAVLGPKPSPGEPLNQGARLALPSKRAKQYMSLRRPTAKLPYACSLSVTSLVSEDASTTLVWSGGSAHGPSSHGMVCFEPQV